MDADTLALKQSYSLPPMFLKVQVNPVKPLNQKMALPLPMVGTSHAISKPYTPTHHTANSLCDSYYP
jgi:hypothetical protein